MWDGSPVWAYSVLMSASPTTLPQATISGSSFLPPEIGRVFDERLARERQRRVRVPGLDDLALVHVVREDADRALRAAEQRVRIELRREDALAPDVHLGVDGLGDIVGLVIEDGAAGAGWSLRRFDPVDADRRRRDGLAMRAGARVVPLPHGADARHPAVERDAQVLVVACREDAAATIHEGGQGGELGVGHW